MGLRMATILFADIVGCSEVSNELSAEEYDKFVTEFQSLGMEAQSLLFPTGEYDDTKFELAVRGDEVCLILHTTPEISTDTWVESEENQRSRREEAEKAFLFAVSLKLLWLVSAYNQGRLNNHQLPRDIGIGIHHGLVVFKPHPQTDRKNTSEGFAINLAKRVEGVSRLGAASRVFVSKEVRDLLRSSSLELEFDKGKPYDLRGITTAPYLHEVREIGNSRPVFETPVMARLSATASTVIEAYYRAARVHDEDFWLRKLVGYVLIAMRDRRALELLEQMDVARNYFEQGNAYIQLEDYDQAIGQYEQADKALPNMHSVSYNMGLAYDRKAEYDDAIRCYRKAVDIKSDNHVAWSNMGAAYAHKDDYDEAIRCFERAVDIKPDYHEAWSNMGAAHIHKDDYDEAIRCCRKAIDIKPDYQSAWYNMACAYAVKEEPEEAARHLSKAIELNSEYRKKAMADEDFDKVRDDPAIKALLEEGA